MRKKVDNRIRHLIERSVQSGHRSFLVMVGDRGRDQVVNLHYIMTKLTPHKQKKAVLWCYKKELGFSSHKKKRMKQLKKRKQKGSFDSNLEDPFELFMTSTEIRYCYYKDTEKILGRTFSMAVLQDFEAITPNILCRTLETVQGGGLVLLLLNSMESLKQFYDVTMDVHNKFKRPGVSEDDPLKPRFNRRFLLSLAKCRNCLVVDDELNILPVSKHAAKLEKPEGPLDPPVDEELQALKAEHKENLPVGSLIQLAATVDQAKAVAALTSTIAEKTLDCTVAVTAARGRGKSAALGLAIAAALAYEYSNIFVTGPSPENLITVFEFIHKGLLAMGLAEHQHFQLVAGTQAEFSNSVVRINVFKTHRQTVQYIAPDDHRYLAQAELLVIDEAAAIPLPTVRKLLGPYLVFMATTVNGYEGTGRALSLKLWEEMRNPKQGKGATKHAPFAVAGDKTAFSPAPFKLRKFRELSLEVCEYAHTFTPIRTYAHTHIHPPMQVRTRACADTCACTRLHKRAHTKQSVCTPTRRRVDCVSLLVC
eukprot:GHVU01231323.1.p1 GENE.GHVU01231323.1~~GHVU01231323.1.p1  ORF type:complete len:536 (+),score=83.43 GHVU01231323.1:222-1829(+)